MSSEVLPSQIESIGQEEGAQNLPNIHLLTRPIRGRDSFSGEPGLTLTFSALVALPLPLLLVVVIFPCMLCVQSSLFPLLFSTFPVPHNCELWQDDGASSNEPNILKDPSGLQVGGSANEAAGIEARSALEQ
jgi:hypothetical protein